MLSRDYRDIIGGLLLVAVGLAYSYYVGTHYNLGELRRMGPGMFPLALGLILAGFGVIMIVPALFRPGIMPTIRFWTPLFVLTSVVAFANIIGIFGLIPAIVAVIVISSLPSNSR
jgi:hypothetical protein